MSQLQEQSSRSSEQLWNRLTTVVLGLTVLILIYYIVIFIRPELAPFGAVEGPTPTPVAMLFTPTPKPTIPVTDTPVPSWTPQPSPTRRPTDTPKPPTPTRTPRPTVRFTLEPTETETPTATIHPYPFKLSEEGIQYMRYFFGSTCDWLGIAGEVVDQEGEPVNDIAIVLNGGGLQNVVQYSGSRPDYAPSGWEHFLDNKVKEGTFTVQLYNQGQPVSELVEVRTRRDCRSNLVYLVFEQVWEDYTP